MDGVEVSIALEFAGDVDVAIRVDRNPAAFIVLGIALVCSSVDTLQNAAAASITRDLSDGKMDLKQARIATLVMIPVAIYLATGPTIVGFTFDALGVFQIFLVADLLATERGIFVDHVHCRLDV